MLVLESVTMNESSFEPMLLCGREFVWGSKTYVMGILNITTDSFSGDGVGSDLKAALARAKSLVADGADIIDIGGESTRPDSRPVTAEEEISRVLTVIKKLSVKIDVPISMIHTSRKWRGLLLRPAPI
jgi:dihydropteroate synthase